MKELVESKVMIGFFILLILVIYVNSTSIRKVEIKDIEKNNVHINI